MLRSEDEQKMLLLHGVFADEDDWKFEVTIEVSIQLQLSNK